MSAERGKGRLQLGLLVAVFALPVVLSSYLYFFGEDLVPRETAAMGSLIDPARPLPPQTLYLADGTPTLLRDLVDKWTIVVMAREDCGESCRRRLRDMDKVRLALGEDSHRAQTLLLMAEPRSEAAWRGLDRELPATRLARVGDEGLGPGLAAAFDLEAPPWGRTFIVDPLGNLMMYYPAGSDPKWVLIDLRRLLKVSQIG